MTETTQARSALAAVLTAAGLPAHAYVPATVTVPAVILRPADPYMIPNRIGRGLRFAMALTCDVITPSLDNEAGLASAEALIESVLGALPDGWNAVRVGKPGVDDLGSQGSVYVTEIDLTAQLDATRSP
jgi:hypothetical protein